MERIADTREDVRNRLLRRVDWRFLTHHPWPDTSMCLASGTLNEGVALISDRMLDPAVAPPDSCDLAVAVDPTGAVLATSARALRANGVFYSEWYSPLAGGARGIRRRLHAAGFLHVRCFWAWPLPSRTTPLFWLPLEAPAAIRYFLAGRPPATGRMTRPLQGTAYAMWHTLAQRGIMAPVYAIATKPPTDHALPATHSIGDSGDAHDAEKRVAVLLTGGRRSINKVVALSFVGDQPEPERVIKHARVPEAVASLQREATTLQQVAQRHPQLQGIPRVLFHDQQTGQLGETVLSGAQLFTVLNRSNFASLAFRATDWLAGLAGQSPSQQPVRWWPRLIAPVIADFTAHFGSIVEDADIEHSRHRLSTLGALPEVCEQRDFSPWNVLVDRAGDLVVLDWESAEIAGLPALDLIYFLTYLAFFLDGAMESGQYRASYRALRNPDSFTGRIWHECIARYCDRIGIDPQQIDPLYGFVWMLHAQSEYRAFRTDIAGSPSNDLLRQSLFVQLWQEELHLETRNTL